MKVIDLLNKIANGEDVPKKIRRGISFYEFDKENSKYRNNLSNHSLFEELSGYKGNFLLNIEIEIIEDTPKKDKKIKRIEERESGWWPNMADGNVSTLKQAINEIIDRLNSDDNE